MASPSIRRGRTRVTSMSRRTDPCCAIPYRSGEFKPSGAAGDHRPSAGRPGHWTRDLAFSPDGATLYVAIGSQTNVAEGHEPPPAPRPRRWRRRKALGAAGSAEPGRATVLAFDPDGKNRRVFADRPAQLLGLTIRPVRTTLVRGQRARHARRQPAARLCDAVEARRLLRLALVLHRRPRRPAPAGSARPDLADKVTVPDVLIQPHSAPLGIAFYDGGNFPPDFQGDAFVALHGSWNRAKRTGYKIVRLRFKDGKPTGVYEDFVTGFVGRRQRLGPPGRRRGCPRRRAAVHRGRQWNAVAGEFGGSEGRARD